MTSATAMPLRSASSTSTIRRFSICPCLGSRPMRLHSSLEILLLQGQAPVIAQKVRYYADREFAEVF